MRSSTIAVISAGLAMALATACSKKENESRVHPGASPRQGNAPPQAEKTPPRPKITDELVTAAIHRRLAASDAVSGERVHVKTEAGAVTLEGTVPHLQAKEAAVQVARATRGVIAVVDQLHVPPSSRTDAQVQAAVEASLRQTAALESREFEVKVQDGHVTLMGEVDSYPEQQAAAATAKAIEGVRSVDNLVHVRLATKRLDKEILADVRRRFKFDRRLDAGDIDVDVTSGKASSTDACQAMPNATAPGKRPG
jgi:hyperosmotically inducible protein